MIVNLKINNTKVNSTDVLVNGAILNKEGDPTILLAASLKIAVLTPTVLFPRKYYELIIKIGNDFEKTFRVPCDFHFANETVDKIENKIVIEINNTNLDIHPESLSYIILTVELPENLQEVAEEQTENTEEQTENTEEQTENTEEQGSGSQEILDLPVQQPQKQNNEWFIGIVIGCALALAGIVTLFTPLFGFGTIPLLGVAFLACFIFGAGLTCLGGYFLSCGIISVAKVKNKITRNSIAAILCGCACVVEAILCLGIPGGGILGTALLVAIQAVLGIAAITTGSIFYNREVKNHEDYTKLENGENSDIARDGSIQNQLNQEPGNVPKLQSNLKDQGIEQS